MVDKTVYKDGETGCQDAAMQEALSDEGRCISCHAIIPEGVKVCPNCEKGATDEQAN